MKNALDERTQLLYAIPNIPYDLVPVNIHTFVEQNYPSAGVVEISRTTSEYEIELSNGIDATFDLHGNFLHFD